MRRLTSPACETLEEDTLGLQSCWRTSLGRVGLLLDLSIFICEKHMEFPPGQLFKDSGKTGKEGEGVTRVSEGSHTNSTCLDAALLTSCLPAPVGVPCFALAFHLQCLFSLRFIYLKDGAAERERRE